MAKTSSLIAEARAFVRATKTTKPRRRIRKFALPARLNASSAKRVPKSPASKTAKAEKATVVKPSKVVTKRAEKLVKRGTMQQTAEQAQAFLQTSPLFDRSKSGYTPFDGTYPG